MIALLWGTYSPELVYILGASLIVFQGPSPHVIQLLCFVLFLIFLRGERY